ncbi:MAG: hypothetical protein WBW03_19500 [Silvibacterium sp.]
MSTHNPKSAILENPSCPDPGCPDSGSPNHCGPNTDRPARGGLRLRVAATAVLLVLAILPAARLASASFDETGVTMGNVDTLDGIVSGTVRISGGRFAFYSGDRFESTTRNLAVNFASGGSLLLCPHSQVQILAANQNSGVMVAFEEGGSQQPFPVHTNDVVMTPDWRIEMQGNVHEGDTGVLQVSTGRRGDLCLTGNVQSGAYFRVSQLVGDAVFNVPGQSHVRLADGHMENSAAGCSCEGASPGADNETSPSPSVAAAPVHMASNVVPAMPTGPSETAQVKKQHPQDVAGYVGSFIHLMFGR